jgi:hypothetical protein
MFGAQKAVDHPWLTANLRGEPPGEHGHEPGRKGHERDPQEPARIVQLAAPAQSPNQETASMMRPMPTIRRKVKNGIITGGFLAETHRAQLLSRPTCQTR